MFKDTPDGQTHFNPVEEAYNVGYDKGRHEAVMQFEKHQKEAESRGFEAGVKEENQRIRNVIAEWDRLDDWETRILLKIIQP